MEISQHIKNLLVTNERVILDGFGAFITKQMSAKYDEATKTMKPPYKIVTFDSEIKSAAGLLSQHIANTDGISREASVEQISEYVKTIKSKLEAGQTVDFFDLGTFNRSADGSINFAFLSQDNLLQKSFGMTEVAIDKSDKIIAQEPKKELKKKPVKRAKTPIKKRRERVKKIKNTTDSNKKRKKWPLFILLFLLVIGIILVAIYFFKPNMWKDGYSFTSEKVLSLKNKITGNDKYDIIKPEDITSDTSKTEKSELERANEDYEDYTDEDDISHEDDDENTIDDNENIIQEEENIDNDVEEEIPEEEMPIETNSEMSSAQAGTFYIIVASVKSEASAKKEQTRFSKKGISTTVIDAGKGRFRISMGEFSSAKEAQNFFENAQAKHGTIDAWVWEKR